jgi:hypothetical protein
MISVKQLRNSFPQLKKPHKSVMEFSDEQLQPLYETVFRNNFEAFFCSYLISYLVLILLVNCAAN